MTVEHADAKPTHAELLPRNPRPGLSAGRLAVAVPLLLIALVWGIHLETALPAARVPAPDEAASAGILSPGEHSVTDSPIEFSGEWYTQPLDAVTSVVTDQPGASTRLRFHGTQVLLTVRVGPESDRAYITVDDEPVPGLSRDERGSFVRLFASKAADRAVVIASGLAHGDHVLTITNGDQGQLAMSTITVEAQTPFPWAFALFYAGILLLLVIAVRGVAWDAIRRLGWAPAPRPGSSAGERR